MTDAYNPATRPCAPGVTSGAKALQHSILGHWDESTDVGTFVCRNNAEGAPSVHGNGRAGDIGRRLALIIEIAEWLVANHTALGVQLVIVNHKIWSVARASEGWRAYGCDRPGSKLDHHTTHVHWEINVDAGSRLTPGIIDAVLHPPNPQPQPEDDMAFVYVDKTGQDGGQVYDSGSVLVKIPTGEDAAALRAAGAKEVKLSHQLWQTLNGMASG